MLKPGGYLEITDPDPMRSKGQVGVEKFDTITCGHNGELIKVPANCPAHEMPFALCWSCRRHICLKCDAEMAKTLKCVVLEKRLEEIEARDRLANSR